MTARPYVASVAQMPPTARSDMRVLYLKHWNAWAVVSGPHDPDRGTIHDILVSMNDAPLLFDNKQDLISALAERGFAVTDNDLLAQTGDAINQGGTT